MAMSRAFDRAMGVAAEYKQATARGETPARLAEMREIISELVGEYQHGKIVLPRAVAVAMGRPDLAAKAEA